MRPTMRLSGIQTLMLAAVLFAPGSARTGEGPSADELIIGLDPAPVVVRVLGKEIPFAGRQYCYYRGMNATAASYRFGTDRDRRTVSVGVYPTVEEAARAEARDVNNCSAPGGEVKGIGDEAIGNGRNLRFRRRNVCIYIGAAGEDECLAIARALDEAMLKSPKAKVVPVPEVVKVHLPEQVTEGEPFLCRLEIREKETDYGLIVETPGLSPADPPVSMYTLRLTAGKPGVQTHEVALVTRDNVIAGTKVTVNVVGRKPKAEQR